jgi:GDP-4-dehydro-6-deoxy-D-mannose reductase
MSTGPPLVTGAAGFAGGHLLEHLLEREPCVAAWSGPSGRKLPVQDDNRVRWTAVDVTNTDEVIRALTGLKPSAIYHCAGIADVHSGWIDPTRALKVNVLGTHGLLAAVERHGLEVPVVVTGSALVYRPSTEALREESALGPESPYGVSKLAQEMLAFASGHHVIVARPFNHIGPRQSDAYVTSSFARQIAEAEAGLREPVLRVGNLESRRDITDVRDMVRAYRLLAERGRPARAYNVCRGEAYRIGDLMERLVRQSHVAIRVEIDPSRLRPNDNPVVLGSAERIRIEAGWEPRIDIDRTLNDLLDHWRHVVTLRGSAP